MRSPRQGPALSPPPALPAPHVLTKLQNHPKADALSPRLYSPPPRNPYGGGIGLMTNAILSPLAAKAHHESRSES